MAKNHSEKDSEFLKAQEIAEQEEASGIHSEETGKHHGVRLVNLTEEVKKAFEVLSRDGEVIQPLECPPYMVIIGSVRDCFGIQWTLMCDFNY